MKYYSEILNKTFNTEEECLKAEQLREKELAEKKAAEAKLAADRKTRAHEIEDARKEMAEAQEKYCKLLKAFVHDYGTYHYSTSDVKTIPYLFDNLFSLL